MRSEVKTKKMVRLMKVKVPLRENNYMIPPKRSMMDAAYQREIEKEKALGEIRRHHGIIYGAQSVNRNVSGFIRRPTQDYDILIRNPGVHARHLERSLDHRFGGDLYKVKPAIHKGTFKVVTKDKAERCIADFSSPTQFPELSVTERDGIKNTTLKFEKGRRKKILADKEMAFRHGKARNDLEMIRYQEQMNKQKWMR